MAPSRMAHRKGFPAHAGMDPRPTSGRRTTRRFPRTRGDGPVTGIIGPAGGGVSPHTRGWTLTWSRRGMRSAGFPAHAGMDPGSSGGPPTVPRFPRTRGDGPLLDPNSREAMRVSPHTRGWTGGLPFLASDPEGFPAHAGMDPEEQAAKAAQARFPRTRGDGPRYRRALVLDGEVSPHTRGWTRSGRRRRVRGLGFPAHAGMDPSGPVRRSRFPRFPRTRGDGPYPRMEGFIHEAVSPHTRGWTRLQRRVPQAAAGFPAHAGMDPERTLSRAAS